MQRKKSIVMASLLFLLAVTVFAVPVTVAFSNGTVQIQKAGSWKPIDIGDQFDSASTVRLLNGAILELSLPGGMKVVIGAAGTYNVATLVKPRTEPAALAGIARKIENLARVPTQTSTVMGVRGDSVQDSSAVIWAGGSAEADAVFDEAETRAREGKFDDAWKTFMNARELYVDAADMAGAAKAAWHASLSGISAKSEAKALVALRSASPDDAGSLKARYALALAAFSVRSGSPGEAKALLLRALEENWFADASDKADARSLLSGL